MAVYETERLKLKDISLGDASLLLDYLLKNRRFFEPWEPFRTENYFTLKSTNSLIENQIKSTKDGNSLSLYIFNRNEDRIIGDVSLTNIVHGVFQSCYLGYKLDESEINNGKMTEALIQVIKIAFEEYKLHRIEANIMPRNIRSINLVKKFGFINEGLSRSYLKINGEWEDHFHFVLLNSEVE